ncbi:hypothetical protein ACFX13_004641 [Malus domestica]
MPLRGSRATWPTVVFCASEAPHLGLYCNFHDLNINQALDHLLGLYPAQYSLRFRPIFVDIPGFSMGISNDIQLLLRLLSLERLLVALLLLQFQVRTLSPL